MFGFDKIQHGRFLLILLVSKSNFLSVYREPSTLEAQRMLQTTNYNCICVVKLKCRRLHSSLHFVKIFYSATNLECGYQNY